MICKFLEYLDNMIPTNFHIYELNIKLLGIGTSKDRY